MDKRLREVCDELITHDHCDTWSRGVESGFEFAIERLRANRFFEHYAHGLADWLELHLTEQVLEPTSTRLKGGK